MNDIPSDEGLALSQMDWLLPIGPRAKGGCTMAASLCKHALSDVLLAQDPQYFKWGSLANENQGELHGFNTFFHQDSF